MSTLLTSKPCTVAELEIPAFAGWLKRMRRPQIAHRKFWEFAYIARALSERGMLAAGMRGLGFAVGSEPLSTCFASLGCYVLATDQPASQQAAGWASSGMHASSLTAINRDGICPADIFERQVRFAPVDMNAIPEVLCHYDFLWSSCAMEHLGGLQHGVDFVQRAMRCLRPGGIAVHTTELNLSSNTETYEDRTTSIYRRRDLDWLFEALASAGHEVEPMQGEEPNEAPDEPEYSNQAEEAHYNRLPHVVMKIRGFSCTSVGLIVRAGPF